MNITIVDLNGKEINLKVNTLIYDHQLTNDMQQVQYEMVLELREFLNEHALTCFFTHYYFEH